jgi:hypothetical protein
LTILTNKLDVASYLSPIFSLATSSIDDRPYRHLGIVKSIVKLICGSATGCYILHLSGLACTWCFVRSVWLRFLQKLYYFLVHYCRRTFNGVVTSWIYVILIKCHLKVETVSYNHLNYKFYENLGGVIINTQIVHMMWFITVTQMMCTQMEIKLSREYLDNQSYKYNFFCK